MEDLSSILKNNNFAVYGGKELSALNELNKYWQNILGSSLAAKCKAFKIEHGQLTIIVEDSSYSVQLNRLQKNILAHIRIVLQDNKLVKSLKFIVGSFSDFNPINLTQPKVKKISKSSPSKNLSIAVASLKKTLSTINDK